MCLYRRKTPKEVLSHHQFYEKKSFINCLKKEKEIYIGDIIINLNAPFLQRPCQAHVKPRIINQQSRCRLLTIYFSQHPLHHFFQKRIIISKNKKPILLIDEAQNLSTELLEQLRLLTNLETNEKKLSEQIDELSALVKRLEDPSIELEDALAVYESGMKIAQAAQKALELAEQRIETVSDNKEH